MTGRWRDETLGDRLLRLAPHLPPGLRLWLARLAAKRSLGAVALQAAGQDPMVLTRLGMHNQALEAGGRGGYLARAAAAAALGDLETARRWRERCGALSKPQSRFLAAQAAPADPRWALDLLPLSDFAGRAACALAAGDLDLAESLLQHARPAQQSRYLAAALATRRGDWRGARKAFNAAFTADGLTGPFDPDRESPTVLSAFAEIASVRRVSGPLISVVMPAKDSAATLRIAADSILVQTWRDLELIIVDDGSRDETLAVAAALAGRDARVRVLANHRGPGAYGARNTGIEAARGGFIALQDADDWAHPERLERQMRILDQDKALTLCRHIRLDDAGHPLCPRVFPFVRLSPITTLSRIEAWRGLGLFDEVPVGADSEWLARFDARFGRRAAPRTPEAGLVALWSGGSLSNSAVTGLTGDGARARTAYVETWRRRHARSQR